MATRKKTTNTVYVSPSFRSHEGKICCIAATTSGVDVGDAVGDDTAPFTLFTTAFKRLAGVGAKVYSGSLGSLMSEE